MDYIELGSILETLLCFVPSIVKIKIMWSHSGKCLFVCLKLKSEVLNGTNSIYTCLQVWTQVFFSEFFTSLELKQRGCAVYSPLIPVQSAHCWKLRFCVLGALTVFLLTLY